MDTNFVGCKYLSFLEFYRFLSNFDRTFLNLKRCLGDYENIRKHGNHYHAPTCQYYAEYNSDDEDDDYIEDDIDIEDEDEYDDEFEEEEYEDEDEDIVDYEL